MPKGYTNKELQELYNSFIGMQQGHLTVVRPATIEENKSQPGNAKWWLCKCECGNTTFVKTAYLQGNAGRGDYKVDSCGCYRFIRHFIANSPILTNEDEQWLYSFYKDDWEKFQFIHQTIVRTSGIKTEDWKSVDFYKNFYYNIYNNEQFNKVWKFWKAQEKLEGTFYDMAKPSLDHIIPKSRGGTNDLDNIQFLTVFENLAKRDMTMEEWNGFKQRTNTTSEYFIESIMRKRGED